MTYYALYHPEQDGTQFRLVVEPTTVVTELSGFSPEGPEHYSMRAGFFSSIDEAVVAVCAENGSEARLQTRLRWRRQHLLLRVSFGHPLTYLRHQMWAGCS